MWVPHYATVHADRQKKRMEDEDEGEEPSLSVYSLIDPISKLDQHSYV